MNNNRYIRQLFIILVITIYYMKIKKNNDQGINENLQKNTHGIELLKWPMYHTDGLIKY